MHSNITMSTVEVLWRKIFLLFGKSEFLMDVIGTNVVAMVVFWTWSGLLATVDVTGKPQWMSNYKSQPGKNQPVDGARLRSAVKVVLINQLLVSIPYFVLMYPLKRWMGLTADPDQLPHLLTVVRDIAVFVVVEEVGFYYSHRLLHWGPLYKSVHKLHHEWTAPIGIVSIYAHPVEYAVSNVTPLALGPILMRSHLLTTWVLYTIAIVVTVAVHSGYHLPFLPSNEFHDYHHLKFNCNYGLTGWLDYLHGTDKQFRNTAQHRRDHILLGLDPAK